MMEPQKGVGSVTLGERIYKYRIEKNFSQLDLAEALEVSRQSVSKWETDASVPDLDKLVKLCDLFGVSMDELVRGVKTEEGRPEPQVIVREVKTGTPARVIVGAVLLVIGAIGGLLIALLAIDPNGLLLGLPVAVCGMVCLAVKKRPGLWCVWLLFLIACIYTPAMIGVNYIPFILLVLAVIMTVIASRKEKKDHETTL